LHSAEKLDLLILLLFYIIITNNEEQRSFNGHFSWTTWVRDCLLSEFIGS